MGKTKELRIKNQTYYFFNDMINIKNFHSDLLKIDKKPYRDFDIYYIGYITIKKFCDCEKNIRSVNPLCLIIHSVAGYFKEKNSELNQKQKQLIAEKKCIMKNIMQKLE